MSGTALAAGGFRLDRRLAPCRSLWVSNTTGGEPQLIHALLDSLGFPGETYETSDEFFDELDRRHAEYLKNPGGAIPADEFIATLKASRSERQHA